MNCPDCQQPMEEITLGQVTVDRCTKCHGIWFDAMEREQLMTLPGSAEDLEKDCVWERNPPEGSALAENPGGFKGINCPRCQIKMAPVWIRRKKNTQRGTLVFGQCKGSYFDAGEFADLEGK